jgi:prevent-host-death family protein
MLVNLNLYILSVQHDKQTIDMKNVSISEFRAHLLKYLKLVQQGEPINVTSKGNVMATLTPPISLQDAARARLDALATTAVIHDVISPVDESWKATQ